MATQSEMRLIEKIARAKLRLEQAKRSHADHCVVEVDLEGYSPCNCGASQTNTAIDAALKELEF